MANVFMRGIAAFLNSALPGWVDLPEAGEPAAGQVRCRTLELGICGTDREILLSQRPWTPAPAEFLVLGHECLAKVEACGPGVTGVQPGDLVVPVVRRPLPTAQARVDMLAFGQFTERGIVREHGFSLPRWLDEPRYLFRVPPELRRYGVLTEPFAVSEKGVNEALLLQRARLGAGAWTTEAPPRVLVTGLGPIGFTAAAVCRCHGWPVAMYGRDAENSARAAVVRGLGATYLPASSDPFTLEDVETQGYDLLLECTGSDEVALHAAGAMASRAIHVWLGSARVPEARSHNVERLMRDVLLRNQLIVGSVNAAPRDFEAALAHLQQLQQERPGWLDRMITARVPPTDEALWHFEHRQPQGIKSVVVYE